MIRNKKRMSKRVKIGIVVSMVAIVVLVFLIGTIFTGRVGVFTGAGESLTESKFVQSLEIAAKETETTTAGSGGVESIVVEEITSEYEIRDYDINPVIVRRYEPVSTFGMDVDTASYTLARKLLLNGQFPDESKVRTEEFINYFDQDFAKSNDEFLINLEGATSKFREEYNILKIDIKANEIPLYERKPANMVFVVDVSGSMRGEGRLELVKDSLRELAKNLRRGDKVGLVAYSTSATVISDLTDDKYKILEAIERLKPEGSTNIEEGLSFGYKIARNGFEAGKINRIILASDGIANTGKITAEEILNQVRSEVYKGITLTTIGVGMGGYNDVLMETLANQGDGNYYYVDDEMEARDLFANGATSLLQVVGFDAKIQVVFNDDVVKHFRLLGYENRQLNYEDFYDNSVDAGEIGVGDTVTALYEIRLSNDAKWNDDVATVRIRYTDLDRGIVNQFEESISVSKVKRPFFFAGSKFRFTTAVAEFAEKLQGNYWTDEVSFEDILKVAKSSRDRSDKEKEFVKMVEKAMTIGERRW